MPKRKARGSVKIVTSSDSRSRKSDLAIATAIALSTCLLYVLVAGPYSRAQSVAPHFVWLADAMLHGRLWLDPAIAGSWPDITRFAGRCWVAFPPMPAILMMPLVAIFGPTGFNDVAFGIALGAINAGLAYLLMRTLTRPGFHGPAVKLSRTAAVALTAFFAFGTLHLYVSLAGMVWFTAHVVAVAFLLIYLILVARGGNSWLSGSMLSAAFLSRTPIVFAGAFAALLALRRFPTNSTRWAWLARFVTPPIAAAVGLLALNAIRFHDPFNFGYVSMEIDPTLVPDLRQHGQFNVQYLGRNLYYALAHLPAVVPHGAVPITFDLLGNSLLCISPALLIGLWPPRPAHAPLYRASWVTIGLVAIPNLLYYNTGSNQFGYRFALDFIPIALIPMALALESGRSRWAWSLFILLLVVSCVMNVLGARWFLMLPPY